MSSITSITQGRRSTMWRVVGAASILVGIAGVLAHGLFFLIWFLGPFAPPDSPRSLDLSREYTIVFFASWAVAGWLVVSGLRVFASQKDGRLGPRSLHFIYLFAQVSVAIAWAVLFVKSDMDVASHPQATEVLRDALFWPVIMIVYPVLLIPALSIGNNER